MKIKTLLLIGYMTATLHFLPGQSPLILPLWPTDAIPNDLHRRDIPERSFINEDSVLIVTDITEPTLSIYLPEKATATGAAVLIIPGGGYWIVAAGHEGEDVARWFNTLGIAAGVLKYRLPDERLWSDPKAVPLKDAEQGMRLLRENAADWHIDPQKIGVLGFSAGGHLAATLCTRWQTEADSALIKPDWAVLVYPVISFEEQGHRGSCESLLGKDASPELIRLYSAEHHVSPFTPSTFLVHSADDGGVSPLNSIFYFSALRAAKVPAELHLFETGGHGYGLASKMNGTVAQWPALCGEWLHRKGLARKP